MVARQRVYDRRRDGRQPAVDAGADRVEKYEEIARLIFSEMRRGVTLLDGEGWYTKQPTKVVMVVCRKYETGTLFKLIKRVDPEAFMTVGNVMGVYGHGFEALKK